jgi:hypothetical protein
MAPAWLRCSFEPFDRGSKAPKFPYCRYAPVSDEADCLRVIQDETGAWDAAFRAELGARLCALIVLLNRSHSFQTTHTVIGSHDPRTIQGYEWATSSLGVAITVMFRETALRFDINAHVQLVHSLCQAFSSPPFAGDSTGWLLGVWPELVLHENPARGDDIRAYGVEIRAAAFDNTEVLCADRLSRMLAWITELLARSARVES